MHRKQAELEERIQQRLRDAEHERQVEVRKVLYFNIPYPLLILIHKNLSDDFQSFIIPSLYDHCIFLPF